MVYRLKCFVANSDYFIGRVLMKKVIFIMGAALLTACSSSKVVMTMESMRLIKSTASPQEVMDFANQNCQSDFYRGASFISKSGDEYTFRCIKFDDKEVLNPVPGTEAAPANSK